MRRVILASGSPRRSDLLTQMGVAYQVVPSNFDEYLDDAIPAEKLTIELGLGKARAVAAQHPDALVIGGDTIVTLNGHHLGKAEDEEDARQTLRAHGGQTAVITTSVVLVCEELGLALTKAVTAKALFKPTNEADIEAYLKTGDWADKAGSWGIQSGGAVFIDHIVGSVDTVIGVPTAVLANFLQSQGIAAKPVTALAPVHINVDKQA